jgi:hypothetical protein
MLALNKESVPLDVDFEGYRTNSAAGRLHVLTARAEGVLAGYYVSVIVPHPHYRTTLFGLVDAYYVVPRFRTALCGLELFLTLEEEMGKLGVRCLISTTKLHYDLSPLFERCGWQPAGKTFTKVL